MDGDGLSAADPHQRQGGGLKGYVKWKDVITGLWHGPDPVLAWVRGSVCVFPQDRQEPLWVPERLTRKCKKNEDSINVGDHQPDLDTSAGGTTMGDSVGVPETVMMQKCIPAFLVLIRV